MTELQPVFLLLDKTLSTATRPTLDMALADLLGGIGASRWSSTRIRFSLILYDRSSARIEQPLGDPRQLWAVPSLGGIGVGNLERAVLQLDSSMPQAIATIQDDGFDIGRTTVIVITRRITQQELLHLERLDRPRSTSVFSFICDASHVQISGKLRTLCGTLDAESNACIALHTVRQGLTGPHSSGNFFSTLDSVPFFNQQARR